MRTNGWRGQLFAWPPSSLHISCVLSFFQRQFIFRYFKNSFEGDFQTVASARAPTAPAVPFSPDMSQSPFLGSQHSFDLILSAICNPLQDTEACTPHAVLYLIFYLPSFSSALSEP